MGNPFCQIYVIALRNENFPLYSRPIPSASLYGATAAIKTASIEGTLGFDPVSQTSSISFAAAPPNGVARTPRRERSPDRR